MLQFSADSLTKTLTKLLNIPLSTNTFPSLQNEEVIPLYKKKRDTHEISNYGPVSLLSCVSKVFERVVHKSMYNYIMDNELLYKYQSGFLPCHNTVLSNCMTMLVKIQNLENTRAEYFVIFPKPSIESGAVAFSINLNHMV